MTSQHLLLRALLLLALCCWVHGSPLSNGHHHHHHEEHHHGKDDHGEYYHDDHYDDHHHDHHDDHTDREHDHLMPLPHSLEEVFHAIQHEGHGEYNPSVKPDNKVKVNITMYVRRLGRLCTHKNELDLQLTYRETFIDERLVGHIHPAAAEGGIGYVTLIGKDVAKIWTPDTFVRNSIESQVAGAIKPNVYARIYPGGKVKVSRRLDLKIACPDIKAQLLSGNGAYCPLGIASYGYQATDLEYSLKKEDVMVGKTSASFLGDLDEKRIELSGISTDSKETTTNSGSTYMSVILNFNLNLTAS